MIQHFTAPDRPGLCCEASQQQAPRAVRASSRETIFHHHLPAGSARRTQSETHRGFDQQLRDLDAVECCTFSYVI